MKKKIFFAIVIAGMFITAYRIESTTLFNLGGVCLFIYLINVLKSKDA